MTLERPEQRIAWELRGLWFKRKPAVVTLSERCMVRRIEGRVTYVSVTGAFAVIDGWHVPCEDVLAVHKPHHSQQQEAAAGGSSMIGPYLSDLTARPYQKISDETRLRVLLKAIDDLRLGFLTVEELVEIAERARS